MASLDYRTNKRGSSAPFLASKCRVWRGGEVQLKKTAKTNKNIPIPVEASKVDDGDQRNLTSSNATDLTEVTTPPQTNQGSGLSPIVRFLQQKCWERLDAMDKMIVRNTLPLVGLTSIVPFVSSIDLFWVNQLGDALAVSAQSAANTVFQFSFGLFSFLPSVTATLVSKYYANNNMEKTGNTIITAFHFGLVSSSLMSVAIFTNPSRFLGAVLKGKTRNK